MWSCLLHWDCQIFAQVQCVNDGGVVLTKPITRGYMSWVKGLMSEPFALALQARSMRAKIAQKIARIFQSKGSIYFWAIFFAFG